MKNTELKEFADKIMSLKLEAMLSDNPMGRLMYVVSVLQNHPFYADIDIMPDFASYHNAQDLSNYVMSKLIDIIKHVEQI